MAKQSAISDALREAIEADPRSRYRMAKETGIGQATLSHFATGRRGLRLTEVDKLAEYLGLELKPKGRKHGKSESQSR